MTKAKNSPTLIEAIHRKTASSQKAGTEVPAWCASSASESAENEAEARGGQAGDPQPAAAGTVEALPRKPIVAIDGPRVVISMSSFGAGAAILLLGALLIGGFELGRRRGVTQGTEKGFQSGIEFVRGDAKDAIQAARSQPPNSDIFGGVGTSPITGGSEPKSAPAAVSESTKAPDEQAATQWVRGHTYIVVQDFRSGDLADAEQAKEFLAERGIETTLLDLSGDYRYRLVANKGFNRDDPNQRKWCDQYHDKIRRLGKAFVNAGGRYRLEGYKKKL
jgi:hypothetical protein